MANEVDRCTETVCHRTASAGKGQPHGFASQSRLQPVSSSSSLPILLLHVFISLKGKATGRRYICTYVCTHVYIHTHEERARVIFHPFIR